MAEWFPLPLHLTQPHPRNKTHLCVAQTMGYVKNNIEAYKANIRNPQFICINCGRAAAKAENLCEPDKLYLNKFNDSEECAVAGKFFTILDPEKPLRQPVFDHPSRSQEYIKFLSKLFFDFHRDI